MKESFFLNGQPKRYNVFEVNDLDDSRSIIISRNNTRIKQTCDSNNREAAIYEKINENN